MWGSNVLIAVIIATIIEILLLEKKVSISKLVGSENIEEMKHNEYLFKDIRNLINRLSKYPHQSCII